MRLYLLYYTIILFSCGDTQNTETIDQDILDILDGFTMPLQNLTSQPVTHDKIKYYVFNSSSPQSYIMVDASNASMLSTSTCIIFLLHGWTQNRTTEWYELTKNALFVYNSRCLVIEVDWSFFGNQNYYNAQYDTKEVGFIIGKFIAILNKEYSIPLVHILVVGHSLGGQVAGFAALDPAGPLFHGRPTTERLAPSDAEVVHVIHTNGGQFGYLSDCGTIDFYPNGGSFQPGCISKVIKALTNTTKTGIPFCSHHRSWHYFIEGILATTPKFVSRKCNYLLFRIFPSFCSKESEEMCSLVTKKTGKFFLSSKSKQPYSK